MTGRLTQIWRHPIKAHGFEELTETPVKAGQTLPWDRTWAVTHEATKVTDGAWAVCANFSRGAKAPHLMAVGAKLDEATGRLTLSHPDKDDLTFHPDKDATAFLDWIAPLMPPDRAASKGIVRTTERGMTDTPFPSISLGNLATLRVLEQRAEQSLDVRRFRINFWIDGLAPFEECEWVGKEISVGDVTFKAEEPITRCTSTMANPETGLRDADPLAVMERHWGHQDLGIALVARTDGRVSVGDQVALAP